MGDQPFSVQEQLQLSVSRAIHWVSFAAIAAIALASWIWFPELWNGKPTAFGTLSGFVTVYGVLFTAIEVIRARSASELAKSAAESAQYKVTSMFNLKNIAECQSCIKFILTDLERDGWASTSALSRVIELYTAEFHEAYGLEASNHRLAIAALQSHAASASGPLKGRALVRLKETLVAMLADLTAAAGGKLSEKK